MRSIVKGADHRLEEEFKWNAPSFRLGAEHRVTLGLERAGGARIVLHRGVSRKDTAEFKFDDPTRLAVWPAEDRGVIKLQTLQEVTEKKERLTDLIKGWLAVPV